MHFVQRSLIDIGRPMLTVLSLFTAACRSVSQTAGELCPAGPALSSSVDPDQSTISHISTGGFTGESIRNRGRSHPVLGIFQGTETASSQVLLFVTSFLPPFWSWGFGIVWCIPEMVHPSCSFPVPVSQRQMILSMTSLVVGAVISGG